MSERDTLHQALHRHLGEALPAQATAHINEALLLVGMLEQQGFEFRLLDARPKSPHATLWRAIFSRQAQLFQKEDEDAALAVCHAALAALDSPN